MAKYETRKPHIVEAYTFNELVFAGIYYFVERGRANELVKGQAERFDWNGYDVIREHEDVYSMVKGEEHHLVTRNDMIVFSEGEVEVVKRDVFNAAYLELF
jgi:hypothetical protein